jgi:hypothetical protein
MAEYKSSFLGNPGDIPMGHDEPFEEPEDLLSEFRYGPPIEDPLQEIFTPDWYDIKEVIKGYSRTEFAEVIGNALQNVQRNIQIVTTIPTSGDQNDEHQVFNRKESKAGMEVFDADVPIQVNENQRIIRVQITTIERERTETDPFNIVIEKEYPL